MVSISSTPAGNFLAHFFERGMRAGRVQLLDDVRDRVADAGDFAKAVLRDDAGRAEDSARARLSAARA